LSRRSDGTGAALAWAPSWPTANEGNTCCLSRSTRVLSRLGGLDENAIVIMHDVRRRCRDRDIVTSPNGCQRVVSKSCKARVDSVPYPQGRMTIRANYLLIGQDTSLYGFQTVPFARELCRNVQEKCKTRVGRCTWYQLKTGNAPDQKSLGSRRRVGCEARKSSSIDLDRPFPSFERTDHGGPTLRQPPSVARQGRSLRDSIRRPSWR
jgi:hypothetical protein